MEKETYNKETIDAKLQSIHDLVYSIDEQTKETNGRVTALEKWRWVVTGGTIALGALSIPNLKIIADLFQ